MGSTFNDSGRSVLPASPGASLAEISDALAALVSRPYHCDGEQGVAEVLAADRSVDLWVYSSVCSIPPGVWEDICHMRVTGDCPCGCGDPLRSHPCIGHDPYTGAALEGPSRRLWVPL